jgi:RNA polymerase sigma factor (sigma-70 family)
MAALSAIAQDSPKGKNPPQQALLHRLLPLVKQVKSPRLTELVREMESGILDLGYIMNSLMIIFRDTRSVKIYTLLYEISQRTFLSSIRSFLKRYGSLQDPHDILQDVFLSIYRYPGSFVENHQNSFRNWSTSIIRNAIFKQMRQARRFHPFQELDVEITDDTTSPSPLNLLVKKEGLLEYGRVYCLSLSLYLHFYNALLTPREKIALHKVEVESLPYKKAAAAMKTTLGNFKMIVCRARKKIYQQAAKISFPLQSPPLDVTA